MPEGRLADPDNSLGTDPRSDPRMIAALAPFGLDANVQLASVTPDSPLEDQLAWGAQSDDVLTALLEALSAAAPTAEGVTTATAQIAGDERADLTLYISRPSASSAPLPCIVHIHGGGMACLSAMNTGYVRWRENLAATGLVVVGVEFRNSAGRLGPHPYPAGLNDCAAGIRWAAAHLNDIGGSHIVVSGESGGGNLTLAVAHKAKREGWLHEIAGVYAQCPMISNRYLEQPDELLSLKENDGYIFNFMDFALVSSLYDPGGHHATDPACWPGQATQTDLAGMPPHVISVNELDPLRDEGVVYYRRLLRAGVPTMGRTLLGTCHASELLCAGTMPDVYMATIRDVRGFAYSLRPRADP